MATLSGHRLAARVASAAAALLSAALTVGASPAAATPAGGPTVEFSGGSVLNLLVCKSEPNAGRVTVPSQARVSFVNRLGQAATLRVDGRPVAQVGANQAVPIVFHAGPVAVSMTFSCGVGVVEEFKSVGVVVTPPVAGDPAAPRPTAGAVVGAAARPASSAPATRTTREPNPRTSAADEATTDGTEPIDPALLGPDTAASTEPGAVAASAGSDNRLLVEPVVPAAGTPHNRPAGLLTLIATVCVVGVGIAAIRAIIAQRSTRTSFA
jgi:hypothetical protein